jgi:CRP-like cAMP-binding protein
MEEENRRSGIDRRQEDIEVDDDQREGDERRIVLSNYEHIVGFMKDIPLFRGFSDSQYKELLNICFQKILPKQCYIYEEGDDSDELYVLTRGNLKVMFHRNIQICTVSPIDIVGETGVFTGTKRTTSVLTTTESTIILIRKSELFKLFKNDSDLSKRMLLNVIYVLSQKIEKYNEIIEDMQIKSRNLMF